MAKKVLWLHEQRCQISISHTCASQSTAIEIRVLMDSVLRVLHTSLLIVIIGQAALSQTLVFSLYKSMCEIEQAFSAGLTCLFLSFVLSADVRICSPPFMVLNSECGPDTVEQIEQHGLTFPFSKSHNSHLSFSETGSTV